MKKIVIKHIQEDLKEILSVSDDVFSKIIDQNDTASLRKVLTSLESFKDISVHYVHVYEYTGQESAKPLKEKEPEVEKKKEKSIKDKALEYEDNSGCLWGFFKSIFWLFKGLFRLVGGIFKMFD